MKFFKITEDQRKILSKPIGSLITGSFKETAEKIKSMYKYKEISFCVGDVVTKNFTINKIKFSVAIVDFKTERKEIEDKLSYDFKLFNPRGYINVEAWKILSLALEKNNGCIVFVEGEEDLLALPAIDVAKEGTLVVYGQPKEGIVVVEVDSKMKEFVREIISSSEKVDL